MIINKDKKGKNMVMQTILIMEILFKKKLKGH